ncbi:MAG: hypothetical protein FJ333_05575 [Sphingomonadales bacterium]|nr:hypothetical protein [Sphingomonadales bacterium]
MIAFLKCKKVRFGNFSFIYTFALFKEQFFYGFFVALLKSETKKVQQHNPTFEKSDKIVQLHNRTFKKSDKKWDCRIALLKRANVQRCEKKV